MVEPRSFLPAAFLLLMSLCLPTPAKGEEKTEIVIGAVSSLSGKLAPVGNEMSWAYQLAVDDVNRGGGIFLRQLGRKLPVRLVIGDDESDAAIGVKAVERLIHQEKAEAILGTHTSDLVISTAKEAERNGIYYHSLSCFMPIFLGNHFKWATSFFFDIAQATEVPFQIWQSLPAEQRPKRHALLMYDTPDGAFFASEFRRSAHRLGFTFHLDEPLPPNHDYLPLILRMKEEGIDSLLIFGDPADCIVFVRQMKQARLNLAYLHGWKGTWTNEFWKALGQDAQYVVSDGFWSEDYPHSGAKRLGDLFQKRFGKRSVSVGLYYAGCQILFQAIERAGSLDPTAIRRAIVGDVFPDTVMGDVAYRQDGAAFFESTANQWWKGELKWFYPFREGAWTLHPMPPWSER